MSCQLFSEPQTGSGLASLNAKMHTPGVTVRPLKQHERVRDIIANCTYHGDRGEAVEALGENVANTDDVVTLELSRIRAPSARGAVGPGASVLKVASAELNRKTARISLDLIDPEASLGQAPADVEIQLNVIAERILGLPRS